MRREGSFLCDPGLSQYKEAADWRTETKDSEVGRKFFIVTLLECVQYFAERFTRCKAPSMAISSQCRSSAAMPQRFRANGDRCKS